MKAYKGFNKDMTCRGFQFEEGKTYEEKEAKLCESGFHACENPLDCFGYYAPGQSVYHEVEIEDVCDERKSDDSKVCGKRITVGAKLDIAYMAKMAVQFVFEKVKKEKATTGDSAHAATTGDRAHAATTGDMAHAATTGKNAISASFGKNGKAKASQSGWIVCAEYDDDFNLLLVKAEKVDGKKVKANTWYSLVNGELVEVDE